MAAGTEPPGFDRKESRRFLRALAAFLALTALFWVAYLTAQPRHDPNAVRPAFDAAYYVDWSAAILAEDRDDARFEGAFYRAPLYPLLLSLLLGQVGVGLAAVPYVQVAAALAATGWLAHQAYRWRGFRAGIATCLLLALYHPWLFFSARLVAESCAIVLLVVALRWVEGRSAMAGALAGLFGGLAVLARPNLLLVVVAWAAWAFLRGQRLKAATLIATTLLAIGPVTVVNWQRSGHFIPVSSNAGLTLYHGNGPGAEGVFTRPDRISSEPGVQRRAATAEASRRLGRDVDPVEADRYWGRQAIAVRWSAPLDTLRLSWNRLLLAVGTREIALDEAPEIDPNPWSRASLVPFAVLFGLAAAGSTSRRGAPAAWTWLAIVACLVTPLVFYVSSRYRLPFAVLLSGPAGVGLVELLDQRRRALVFAVVGILLSLASPWIATLTISRERPWESERAAGYAQLARASWRLGEESLADADRWKASARKFLEAGRAVDPAAAEVLAASARIAEIEGRGSEAEAAWLAVWDLRRLAAPRRPSADLLVSAAINLSAMWVRDGRPSAAADMLAEAIDLAPLNEDSWNNRIVALLAAGRLDEARGAIRRAKSHGLAVSPELEAAAFPAEGSP